MTIATSLDPKNVARIELRTPGKSVLVDAADYERFAQYRWYLCGHRYAGRMIKHPDGKRGVSYMHREILGLQPGQEGDHINGDGLDNRRCNLRASSVSQNQFNRPPPKTNTSGFKGVSFVSARKRSAQWLAWIEVDGQSRHLGWFLTKEAAVAARLAAEAELHGEFMHQSARVALDRLTRLERQYDGPVPAPLRAWALSGAPALPAVAPAPAPTTDHRAMAAAAFKEAKKQLAKAQRHAIHRDWAVTRADKRYRTYLVKTCRQAARAYLGAWRKHRDAEREALTLAAE